MNTLPQTPKGALNFNLTLALSLEARESLRGFSSAFSRVKCIEAPLGDWGITKSVNSFR